MDNRGQITVRVPEHIAADIMICDGNATALDLSDESVRFITALMNSKMQRRGNARWYEVSVTDDEIIAVINEILVTLLYDLDDRADSMWVRTERQAINRYKRQVKAFIEEHSTESDDD